MIGQIIGSFSKYELSGLFVYYNERQCGIVESIQDLETEVALVLTFLPNECVLLNELLSLISLHLT